MASYSLAKRVDTNIRPQDDLYRHVNGKWLASAKIPADQSAWGTFYQLREDNLKRLKAIADELVSGTAKTDIEQKVHDFYLSATSEVAANNGIPLLQELLARVDTLRTQEELFELVGQLHLYGIFAFWYLYIEPDEQDNSRYILRLSQGGISLPDRDYYLLKDKKMKQLRSEYKNHIPKMLNLLEQSSSWDATIIEIETKLARASRSSVDMRNLDALYNLQSFKKLAATNKHIDWRAYFKKLGIKPPESLVVEVPEFFTHIDGFFAAKPIGHWKAYLKWHIVANLASFTGEVMAKANFEFFGTKLSGAPKMKPRWQRAITKLDLTIGDALGSLYIQRHFPAVARQRMEQLVQDVKAAFAERLKRLELMDEPTKRAALKKLTKMEVKIGHAKKLQRYKSLSIHPDNYLANYLAAREHESKRQLRKLPKEVDPDEWFMSPPTVNAYFSFNRNEMAFPAGILQPPFFDHKASDAYNYGGIGTVIGHEITHGFDDQGCLYNYLGNRSNWWSKAVKADFERRTKVMVAQANAFEVLPGRRLKGQLTLGENIADVGGAEIAFEALQLAWGRKQSKLVDKNSAKDFFYNFSVCECQIWRPELALQALLSDPHSPGEFRVNNTVRNMDAFHGVFATKPKDKLFLSPEKRVRIW